jgi:trigger factor
MKVEVESLDSVRKNIEVVLDESKVNELREGIYQDLKKHAKIKGFRPGKVPRSIIQTYYKDYIEDELKRKMVEETMGDALSETKVEPVSEPRVEFLEDEGRFGYKMECEVVPEFETPSYKGIEVEVERIDVTEEDIAKRLESMQQMHTQLMDKEEDQPAQKGDFVIVKYEAFHDGKPVKGVKAESYPLDLGSANLTPEFENGIVGMKVGEEKEIAIPFAADYPDKDVAGKIKEKKLPELSDDFAKDLSFENMDQLRAEVKKGLETEKEGQRKNIIAEQIVNSLLEKSDFPVPARMAQKRAEMLVQDARSRMKVGTLSDEEDRSLNAALLKEYEPEAQKRIKMGLILVKIAEQEGLKVEDSEVDERLQRIAEETKRAYDYIREFYEKYNLRGNLKTSMLEEKTMSLLIEHAVVKEKE